MSKCRHSCHEKYLCTKDTVFVFCFFQGSKSGASVQNGCGVVNGSKTIENSHKDSNKQPERVPDKKEDIHGLTKCLNASDTESQTDKTQQNRSNSSFGGMKKGFLFGGPSSKDKFKAKQTSAGDRRTKQTLEDIPFVRKNENNGDSPLRFTEVQEAMAKTNEKLMQNKGLLLIKRFFVYQYLLALHV